MNARSAVLFLVFNRPDTTARVFEAIRAARPRRLYVAADGPRAQRPGEDERCRAVRRIATAVDWPCEVSTLMRQENLGCKRAVSSAISWFFDNEQEGVILEDDCVPDPSFFPYCDELLERYRDDSRVMCISGDNFISSTWKPLSSYYFSRYVHIWGWASWRRAWRFYDVDMTAWRAGAQREVLEQVLPALPIARDHWRRHFEAVSNGEIDTWDYQWAYACWKQGGLCSIPAVNMISNIGFGQDATHTVSPESKLANLPVDALHLPLRHPASCEADEDADRWSSEHVFGIPTRRLSIARLRRGVKSRVGRALSALKS
jgi:hypothetical protein